MSVKTKAQKDMALACLLVSEVAGKSDETKKIYGGLCHSFPVMVRQCGLCQALAFSESKKASNENDRLDAHAILLQHVGRLIKSDNPLEEVRNADTTMYMLHTRRILSAWIYFKRFAVSILKVESGGNE